MNVYFDPRKTLTARQSLITEVVGLGLLLGIWSLLSQTGVLPERILPAPSDIALAGWDLWQRGMLVDNAAYSIGLNAVGYAIAVAISVPFGFALGLVPLVRGMLGRITNAGRFIPLPAMVGVFIGWFGIYTTMKAAFLAAGITVYLIPTVAQRLSEVKTLHLDTVQTLGGSRWQMVRHVWAPYALSRLSDDVRVLVGISWTYIVVAETINRTGGLGAISWQMGRQGKLPSVYAILFIIVLIGLTQDRLLVALDRFLFPHKHIN